MTKSQRASLMKDTEVTPMRPPANDSAFAPSISRWERHFALWKLDIEVEGRRSAKRVNTVSRLKDSISSGLGYTHAHFGYN